MSSTVDTSTRKWLLRAYWAKGHAPEGHPKDKPAYESTVRGDLNLDVVMCGLENDPRYTRITVSGL